ncbi:flavodoxin [Companilactobacillus kimchii]|uniref:Flavodoxin n=2 Tax=Companilactobacillus kimchii TaxID=2801452 RepID=A0ABR5NRN5_9LACO|nr:flavodoxin [Companilactobacillus kimchii]GEO47524.1 flavodoxin [Companilactobacillus paralimentarius]KAE9559326.1 flavodoxin [Companilactobacillus kimchii]KAE9560849.1 flavodoxin [Companilactobacillus kimchii]KRK50719.1 flavodoxin [Companilactobacillus kimchii DSM 13961 = JCM 10707]OWF32476.1 putative flavodoxin-1 [Companilactobacillus kimchii]
MTKVKIVFASITGNDEDIAYVLTEKFEDLGCDVDMSEVSQTDVADFEDSDICVIASYTYDQGVVPDEALDFYDDMQDLDLNGKVYGVCGSGDTFYEDFCRAVEEFDKVFQQTGATRGADTVKVELGPEQEDIDNLDNFAEQIFKKAQEMDL